MKALFIVNPAAGHGRAGARWGKARALAEGICPGLEARVTERPGHGRELAREALLGGCELVVAVGGDGTLGEVVDGYLAVPEAARRAACVATFPAGSGCDFAGHMKIPREPEAWAAAFAAGTRRRLDAARATFRGADGEPRARHFLNVAALGIPGDVAVTVARRGKAWGSLTYLLEGALAVLSARPRRMTVVVDGVVEAPAEYHLLAAANTSTFGGGMRLAPQADAEDGLLDLLTIGPVSRASLMSLLPRAYSGGHIGAEGVVLRRAARVEVRSEEDLPLNLDGDADGRAPVVFEAMPKAVAFRL